MHYKIFDYTIIFSIKKENKNRDRMWPDLWGWVCVSVFLYLISNKFKTYNNLKREAQNADNTNRALEQYKGNTYLQLQWVSRG